MPPRPKSGDTSKSGRKPIRSIQTGTDILRNVRSSRNSESIAMKPGLNRRDYRLRSRGALQRLEPDEGKLSRPVLRGGSGSNVPPLPDPDFNAPGKLPKLRKFNWTATRTGTGRRC